MYKLKECRTIFDVFNERYQSRPSNLFSNSPEELLTTTRWALESLESARDRLNACKGQLSSLPLSEWQRHTDFTEISSNIRRVIVKNFAPTNPPILTRAWIKFYEIIQTQKVLNIETVENQSVRAFFLCEGNYTISILKIWFNTCF